ncbi:MAG: ZIP family metal transporter [Bacteroidales bacterium]
MDSKLLQAFLVALIAGLSLAIGGIFPLVLKYKKKEILPFILSFTGGIMLYVAFVKFLPSSTYQLNLYYDASAAFRLSSIGFFVGLLITVPIDMVLAHVQKKIRKQKTVTSEIQQRRESELFFLIFLSITIHNFFEGIATFLTYFSEKIIAIPVILSIIAHNIPEGAVITMVIYKSSKSKKKAILFCLVTALAEPLGAIGAYLLLHETFTPAYLGIVKAFLAGLLVNTALDELIPGANQKGGHRLSIKGIIGGMLFIGILLILAN